MTTLEPLVCGSCGALVTVSPGVTIAQCEFCKATFELPAVPQAKPHVYIGSATSPARERSKSITAYVVVLIVLVGGGLAAAFALASRDTRPTSSPSNAHKSADGKYKVGDSIVVDWHGQPYDATVLSVDLGDRYRIHYDGWSSSWDEDVPASRIEGLR